MGYVKSQILSAPQSAGLISKSGKMTLKYRFLAVECLLIDLKSLSQGGRTELFKASDIDTVPDTSVIQQWMEIDNEDGVMQCMNEESKEEEERCLKVLAGVKEESRDMADDGDTLSMARM